MLIKKAPDMRYSEVTPEKLYRNRREFLAGIAAATGTALLSADPVRKLLRLKSVSASGKWENLLKSPLSTDEKPTSFQDVTNYNNFYEFTTDWYKVAELAKDFKTRPWTLSVEGEVAKPQKFDIDSLLKIAPLEERIYRHRCVEAWSMVVPWIGFSLSALIDKVQPTSKAQYVEFISALAPSQMPGLKHVGLNWPYREGLRMDEARHPLALLCFGMYSDDLPPQDGAPVRMIVPWKYGFKSGKSVVKIRFVVKEPVTTWNESNPIWYGFYSNVNPDVDRPRWSQDTERRLGEFYKRKTLLFNGYNQVASLYTGMDLRKYY